MSFYLLYMLKILFIFFFCYFLILLFFFFQAEDGIRDLYVTGVQTCALPILNGQQFPLLNKQPVQGFSALLDNGDGSFMGMLDNGYGALENSSDFHLRVRSEERRVGKECRSRWSPDQ